MKVEIRRVWEEKYAVYGVEKVWTQLKREGIAVVRCTVTRWMTDSGFLGAMRGRAFKTTISGDEASRPLHLVDREFRVSRPNELRVSDLTYVATWRGFKYVVFVIDALVD